MPQITTELKLRKNEIFSSLFNMIISQQVFADNIAGTFSTLVDSARVDGGLYGDTKLYTATDVLASAPWGNDAEATNLLKLHRPTAPKTQSIVIDQFRQISLTVDNYLSKRAWAREGAFSEFTSVLLGWVSTTKRIYDSTKYNAFIGTDKSTGSAQNIQLTLGAKGTEAENRLRAQTIAEGLANLFIRMSDVSRDFNDYGFLRSYDLGSLKVVWNSAYVNEINKIDLPTIFHKEGLMEKFEQYVLPSRYFGTVGTDAVPSSTGNERSLIEKDYNSVEMSNSAYDPKLHIFPGDKVPKGKRLEAKEYYTEDAKVICKVYTKLPPYMSAFEVGTSFFNPKSLTENHYLTFSHNTIEHLSNYPCVSVKEA